MMEAGIIIAVIALVACAAVGGYALGRMDEAVRNLERCLPQKKDS